jgi:hypothetical protein
MRAPSIRIHGPGHDGQYAIELRACDGQSVALMVPPGKAKTVLREIQERIPYGHQFCDPFDVIPAQLHAFGMRKTS